MSTHTVTGQFKDVRVASYYMYIHVQAWNNYYSPCNPLHMYMYNQCVDGSTYMYTYMYIHVAHNFQSINTKPHT